MSILELLQEEIETSEVTNDLAKDKEIVNILKDDSDSTNLINEDYFIEAEKKAGAAVRNKPSPIFDATHPKVTDDKDHFQIASVKNARNALARMEQFTSAPKWWKGTLTQLKNAIIKAVKKAYPSIEVTEKVKEEK